MQSACVMYVYVYGHSYLSLSLSLSISCTLLSQLKQKHTNAYPMCEIGVAYALFGCGLLKSAHFAVNKDTLLLIRTLCCQYAHFAVNKHTL